MSCFLFIFYLNSCNAHKFTYLQSFSPGADSQNNNFLFGRAPPYHPLTSVPNRPSDPGPPIQRLSTISDDPWCLYFTSRKLSEDDVGRETRVASPLYQATSCRNQIRTEGGPKLPLTAYPLSLTASCLVTYKLTSHACVASCHVTATCPFHITVRTWWRHADVIPTTSLCWRHPSYNVTSC